MARLTDLNEGRLDAPKLDPRIVIIRPGFNYRDTKSDAAEKHIQWLMQSIMATGVQEPIRVEYSGGKVYVVNGECRVIACRRLWDQGVKVPYKSGGEGPPLVPAIQISGDEAQVLAASMVANGALPPTKMEFGAAADRLMKLGWDISRIADYIPPHIGVKGAKAKRYVTEAVELNHAPIDVKKAVREGVDGVQVSEGLALAASKSPLHAKGTIQAAVDDAKSKGKTVAKRPKGEGKVTKQRHDFQAFTDKLLEAADLLASMILDDDIPIGEIQKKAKQYQRLRKG